MIKGKEREDIHMERYRHKKIRNIHEIMAIIEYLFL
jgi:hypothetical protein